MNCPKCNNKLYCIDSRPLGDHAKTRKYVCISCKHHFGSDEYLEVLPLKKLGVPKHLTKRLKGRSE